MLHQKLPLNSEFECGPFILTRGGNLRLPSGAEVHLPSRLARLMLTLMRAGGAPVSRHELIASCWGTKTHSGQNLSRAITDLRNILRDLGKARSK